MLTEEQKAFIALRVSKRHLQNHKAALKHLNEELRAAGYKQISSKEFDEIEELVRCYLDTQIHTIDLGILCTQLAEVCSDNSN